MARHYIALSERTLKPFYEKLHGSSNSNIGRLSEEEGQIIREILAATRNYTRWLIEDTLLSSMHEDMDLEDAQHVDQLLSSAPDSCSEYLRALMASQQFSVYAIKIAGRFRESADAVKTMLRKLVDMIEDAEVQIQVTKEVIAMHTSKLREYENTLETCRTAKDNLLQQILADHDLPSSASSSFDETAIDHVYSLTHCSRSNSSS
jgi:hypothetical protein